MMRRAMSGFLMLVCAQAVGAADAVALAYADARKLPPDLVNRCRYLTLDHLEEMEQALGRLALAFGCNSLSREPEIAFLGPVGNGVVLRVNMDDYGWSRDVWEKLAQVDPYFHAKVRQVEVKAAPAREVEVEVIEEWPGGVWHEDGINYPKGAFKTKRKVKKLIPAVEAVAGDKVQTAISPLLTRTPEGLAAINGLIALTQSQAPIVRGDWFFSRVSLQKDRDGTGYYDFLGLKKGADYDKLVGFDEKLADQFKAEIFGVKARGSEVAENNRRLVRRGKIAGAFGAGAYWFTLDVKNNLDKRNFLRVLDRGFEYDASERISDLPNGLQAWVLENAQRELQDTAPDFIAGNRRSRTADTRVHVGFGGSHACIACHHGYIPIADEIRETYPPGGPFKLNGANYEEDKRLRQLYGSDLEGRLDLDTQIFVRALFRVNGLTPAQNAEACIRFFHDYQDAPVTARTAARELGVTELVMQTKFRAYTLARKNLDPIFARLAQGLDVRREHFEEIFQVGVAVVYGLEVPPP